MTRVLLLDARCVRTRLQSRRFLRGTARSIPSPAGGTQATGKIRGLVPRGYRDAIKGETEESVKGRIIRRTVQALGSWTVSDRLDVDQNNEEKGSRADSHLHDTSNSVDLL